MLVYDFIFSSRVSIVEPIFWLVDWNFSETQEAIQPLRSGCQEKGDVSKVIWERISVVKSPKIGPPRDNPSTADKIIRVPATWAILRTNFFFRSTSISYKFISKSSLSVAETLWYNLSMTLLSMQIHTSRPVKRPDSASAVINDSSCDTLCC